MLARLRRFGPVALAVLVTSCVGGDCQTVGSVSIYGFEPGAWTVVVDDGATTLDCDFRFPDTSFLCGSREVDGMEMRIPWNAPDHLQVLMWTFPRSVHVRVLRDDAVRADRVIAMHYDDLSCSGGDEAMDLR